MLPLALMFAAAGLLFAAIAVPLLQRRVKPNPWYGFRVPRTLNDEDRWYAVNAYAARFLFWGGMATAMLALVLDLLVAEPAVFLTIMTVVVLAGPVLSLVLGLRYLSTLP
jgi:uncharacterized membrane protein